MTFSAGDLDERIDEVDGWNDVAESLTWRPAYHDVDGFGRLEYVELVIDGDDRQLIFKIGDRLFSKGGYYSSYDGGEWDGSCEEVERYEYTTHAYRSKR